MWVEAEERVCEEGKRECVSLDIWNYWGGKCRRILSWGKLRMTVLVRNWGGYLLDEDDAEGNWGQQLFDGSCSLHYRWPLDWHLPLGLGNIQNQTSAQVWNCVSTLFSSFQFWDQTFRWQNNWHADWTIAVKRDWTWSMRRAWGWPGASTWMVATTTCCIPPFLTDDLQREPGQQSRSWSTHWFCWESSFFLLEN